MKKALVVFSGGQDSTTCLYWALKKYGKAQVHALVFDYGQRHKIELKSAAKIAKLTGVPLTKLSIPTFRELGGNSLTSSLAVKADYKKNELPNTFVPGRNLIFLTFAAAFAYQHNIHDLITGVSQTDYSGYPDCRTNTLKALARSLSLGMDFPIRIHTPLIHLTKAETVQLAKKVGALPALALSHTCYNGKRPPCGTCPACKLRAKGFKEAGINDPLTKRPLKTKRLSKQ